jgi:tetratricopeptide (TPR) repeat protein
MYLPSVGFFIAVLSVMEVVREKTGDRIVFIRKAVIYGMVFAVASLSAAAYARNTVWHGEERLWKDAVRKSPHKARPHVSLGVAYFDQGRLDEAIREYQTALKFNPQYAKARNNLETLYKMKNNRQWK